MSTDLRPIAAGASVELESRTPKRESFIRETLSQKKRKSRDNPVLHPDPFRYGDPNPLGCHPYFGDKHPDYIHRPHTVQRPLSFPVFSATTGSGRLSIYSQDDLEAYRVQGFVPRLMSMESLAAIFRFFDGNTLTRAMSNSQTPAREPPEKKPPVNSFASLLTPPPTPVRRNSDTSLREFIKGHEAATAKRIKEERRNEQNSSPAPVSASPKKASLSSSSYRHFGQKDTEPCIKHSSNSGLPKGWKATHDRFIAYLDTHAPLGWDGGIAFREYKKPRYTADQMVSLLKERFVRFRNIHIPTWAIERRLVILDYRDNDYFDMPYYRYSSEPWGKGI